MPLIDLSHPLVSGMPVYPGDPEVSLSSALRIDDDGVAVSRLDLGSHAGTHLDAPAHVVPGGATVDHLPLEWLCGRARVLQCSQPEARLLTVGDLGDLEDAQRPVDSPPLPFIVCLATGWDRHFGTASMVEHPVVSLDLAQFLWARGARVLALDTLSPDPTASPPEGEPTTATGGPASGTPDPGTPDPGAPDPGAPDPDGTVPHSAMPVHDFWLGNGGVIVENLLGLTRLPGVVELSLLPLRIRGGDGSPVRAVARFD